MSIPKFVGRHDVPGDAATNPTAAPMPDPSPGGTCGEACFATAVMPSAAAGTSQSPPGTPRLEKGKWARKEPPTDAKEAQKFIEAVVEGHELGVQFFHPGYGTNVVKVPDGRGGFTFAVPQSPDPVYPEAWYAAGCVGPAPLATPEQVEEQLRIRTEFEEGTAPRRTAKKAGDEGEKQKD